MILTRNWRNGDMIHLKRKKFKDILHAVQDLEKRGYSCIHPIRSLVQRQREFIHKRTNGKISTANYSFKQTDADICYVVMMRREKKRVKNMPKQLTIFDVEPVVSFDSKKANVHRLNSKLRFTDVVVQIPRQAKAIDGLKATTAPDNRYELFEEYAIGIWRYKQAGDRQFEWEEAEEMCKRARDNKEPVSIRLYLSFEQPFIPENVVQYL